MPKFFGSLKDHEEFVTPTGKRLIKTTKQGAACLKADNAVLLYFADDNRVLTPDEYARVEAKEVTVEELLNPPPPPPAPVETPAEVSSLAPAEPVAPSPAAPVDASEFDADPPPPPAPVETPKSGKKK